MAEADTVLLPQWFSLFSQWRRDEIRLRLLPRELFDLEVVVN